MSRNRKFATTLKLNDFEFSLEAASLQNLVFGTHATKVEKIANLVFGLTRVGKSDCKYKTGTRQ
jgi:hypothetical protein